MLESPDPQFHALLEVVEGLRQDVKALPVTVQNMQSAQRRLESRIAEGRMLSPKCLREVANHMPVQ